MEVNLTIRSVMDTDRTSLPSLLAPDAGDIWRNQCFPLHGNPHAQTLIAERDGQVVGAISVADNAIHPTGLACAIDVHPGFRRQGIGSALLQAMREASRDRRPFRTKIETAAGEQFLRAQGGRVYQVSPGHVVSLANSGNQAWADAGAISAEISVLPAAEISPEDLLTAFVELYIWQHAAWNPVGSLAALTTALAGELDALDRQVSAVALQNGRIVALALAFPADDGALDVVAETTAEMVPGGREVLAATIVALVRQAARAGWDRLVFDGHLTDPHLEPVIESIPQVQSGPPLLLMEIPA